MDLDVPGQDYQALFDVRQAEGFMPRSLTARVDGGSTRFQVTWVPQGGSWYARHDDTAVALAAAAASFQITGFRPVFLESYGSVGDERFASLWIHEPSTAWQFRYGLTSSQYQTEFNSLAAQGYTLYWVSANGSGANARFASVFLATGVVFQAVHDVSEAQVLTLAGDPALQLVSLSSYGGLFAASFHSVGANGVNRFNLTRYEAMLETASRGQGGYQPAIVDARVIGGVPRFSVNYRFTSSTNTWRVYGVANPGMQAFETTVRTYMQANGVRQAALAVVRNGSLMLLHGYTWAPVTSHDTTTKTVFRAASLSKPLTAVAILRLVQDGRMGPAGLDTLLRDRISMGAWASVDSRVNLITIRHLLHHRGGFDRNVSGDPMFNDLAIAAALSQALPVSSADIIEWMQTRPLDFTPGTAYRYSNFGYLLLGRVIETVSGQPYASFVQSEVLAPVGAVGMSIGESLFGQQALGEAIYGSLPGQQVASVMGGAGPATVPIQYGGWNVRNFDAHGGWIAPALDLARFAASFDSPTQSPLLSTAWIQTMFSRFASDPTPSNYYAMGWFVIPVGSSQTTWHDGLLTPDSTRSYLVRRHDGVSWVLLFGSAPPDTSIDAAMQTAANSVTSWPTNDLFPNYTRTVSGIVATGGSGVSGVVMSGFPTPVATGPNGSYSTTVSVGWSGVVVPTHPAYSFIPSTRTYSNVSQSWTAENYGATLNTYTISGSVTTGGTGLGNVTLAGFPGGSVTTLPDGSYSTTVPHGWSGTVTPNLAGHTFAPAAIAYLSVMQSSSGQDYVGTANTYSLAGVVSHAGVGLAGVTLQGFPTGGVVTGADGSYTTTVTHGWGGTVSPSLIGYTFAPTSINYSAVTQSLTGENYAAVVATYAVSGTVTRNGVGLPGVSISGFPNPVITQAGGTYSATVDHGWSGTVTPTLGASVFLPGSRSYASVTQPTAGHDYVTCQADWLPYVVGGTSGPARATANWDPDGAGPQSPRWVVAGRFAVVGGLSVGNIAVHDPVASTWSTLGAGVDGEIRALAPQPNGDLVVGGSFTSAGGESASRVARWDGANWSPLGLGPNGTVYALATLANGDVVAAGSFSSAGGVAVANIAKWDGLSWTPLGAGVGGPVYCLTILANGDLVAGGGFVLAGGAIVHSIARWNGVAWSPLAAGLTTGSGGIANVQDLAVLSNGDLVAGGWFGLATGTPVNNIAKWNGSSWIPLGAGPGVIVNAVVELPGGDLLAAGRQMVARWNGAAWTTVTTSIVGGPGDEVFDLAVGPTGSVLAGGSFAVQLPGPAENGIRNVALWNGSTWMPLTPSLNNTVYALRQLPNGDVLAGGRFSALAGFGAAAIARSDGSSWSSLGGGVGPSTPPLGAMVLDITSLPNGNVVVGGFFTTAGSVPVNNIAQWNGTSWSALGTGVSSWVSVLGVLPNGDLVAGGPFTSAGGVPANGIARWNGAAWSALGTGLAGGSFPSGPCAMCIRANGDVVVGGGFTSAGGVPANGIASWNGVAWASLGSGMDGSVSALTPLVNGDVVAGGAFTTAGGVPANNVAKWNGAAWSALGTGVSGGVTSLTTLANGDVVAGGTGVSRWNGSTWSPLGNGAPSVIVLTTLDSGEVIASGSFSALGSHAANYVARMATNCPAAAAPFGSGCAGSAGLNTLVARTPPWLGGTFVAEATGMPAVGWVVAVTGFATTSVPLGVILAPGLPGCSLLVTPDLTDVVLPAAGIAQTQLVMPITPGIIGLTFFHQVLPFELDPVGALIAVTSSNGLALTVGTL